MRSERSAQRRLLCLSARVVRVVRQVAYLGGKECVLGAVTQALGPVDRGGSIPIARIGRVVDQTIRRSLHLQRREPRSAKELLVVPIPRDGVEETSTGRLREWPSPDCSVIRTVGFKNVSHTVERAYLSFTIVDFILLAPDVRRKTTGFSDII
jgi:hypothetical protein